MEGLKYTCRGPAVGVVTQADVDAGLVTAQALGHTKRGVPRHRTITPGAVRVDEHSGEIVTIEPVVETDLVPCGYDLSLLYAVLPADGLVYDITCPRCGAVSKPYKTP